MSNIEDFIARVVPWPENDQAAGYINLHWTSRSGPGMRGRPYKRVSEFMDMAQWGAGKPSVMKDIYFCLSSQRGTGKVINGKQTALRNSGNVHRLKALWMDIDVKPEKGYATLPEAIDALKAFTQAAAIPGPSAVVLSGGGVHAYWISDTPLTKAEWEPYAEGLEALAKQHGLKRDPGLTTDSVRVLRVPGTFNYKTTPPKGVRLAALAPTNINFVTAFSHIKATLAPATASVTKAVGLLYDPAKFPSRMLPANTPSLADGVHIRDDTPLAYEEVFSNCPHFIETRKSHGVGVQQGLWMLDILATTFMQDGPGIARLLSNGYTTYTAEETDRMYARKVAERAERGLGWPSCEAFESAGCKECAGCPFKGKIKSPLNLAARASAPIHLVTGAPPPPPELHLPEGYTVDDNGIICAIVEVTLQGGGTDQKLAPMFRCRITDPWADEKGLHFTTSVDLDRTKPVVIRDEDIATDTRLFPQLWKQGVKIYVENEKKVRPFMSAFIDQLDHEKKRLTTIPFGWLIENGVEAGFAYNGKVFRADGVAQPSGQPNADLRETYTPKGQPEPWLKAMKLITDQHRPDLEALAAIGFAAPLIRMTGQYAGMVIGYSSESGAHKSTALRTGLAVWANPKKSKDVPSASDIALGIKLGQLANLPMVWDELSNEKKIERVVGFVGEFTEGIVGNKATQNRELRVPEEWQSIIGVGANKSIWDRAKKLDRSTDAPLRRLFEMKITKKLGTIRKSDAAELIFSLDNNYGWAGVQYAEYLGRNPAKVKADVKAILRMYEDELSVLDEERFWASVCACMVAGAQYSNILCGTAFNVGELYNFLRKEILWHRERIADFAVVGGSETNAADVLSQFIKMHPNNQMWITHVPSGRGRQTFRVIHQNDTQHPKPVHIQWVRDNRLLRLSQAALETYLDPTPYGRSTVMDGLRDHFDMKVLKSRIDLGAWTPNGGAPETVLELPIPPGHPLEQILFQGTPIEDLPADYGGVIDPGPAIALASLVGATGPHGQVAGS